MRKCGIWGFLLLFRLADAADLRSFEIWSTVGAGSGTALGATLLKVEPTSDGSLVRFVYSGLGDFACNRTTVMAWQKRIIGKTPTDLARPVDLCQSERKLNRFKSKIERRRSKQIVYGIEHDSETLHVQCGEGWHRFLPIELAHEFESRVMAAAWGDHPPDLNVIDPAAERDGQEFVEIARQWNYGPDPTIETFYRFLFDYSGPIGKPAHDWRVETGNGLRLRQFVEPRVGELAWGQSKSSSLPFQLTLDRRSGKVLKSEALVDWNGPRLVPAVWRASLNWVFDPSTIPENAVNTVTVHFHPNCGEQN